MIDIRNVGIISSGCICKGRWSSLLFEPPCMDLWKQAGAVLTVLDSKPWLYSGTRSREKHTIIGFAAIRFNSNWSQHCYSLWQQHLKLYLHRLKCVYTFWPRLLYNCTRSWHNTSNHQLRRSLASRWKYFWPQLIVSQIKHWRIAYPITAVECAVYTALGVCICVGWFQGRDNLRTTQSALWCTGTEWKKRYVMQKEHLASWISVTASTKSCLDTPHSPGA